jgi:hypothetical protein
VADHSKSTLVVLTRSRPTGSRGSTPRVDSPSWQAAEVLRKVGLAPKRVPVELSTAETLYHWCWTGQHRPERSFSRGACGTSGICAALVDHLWLTYASANS